MLIAIIVNVQNFLSYSAQTQTNQWRCVSSLADLSLSLSVLTAISQVNLDQLVFTEANGGSGGNNHSHKTCKAPVKSSPPTNQHLAFYRPDALPVAQPTVSKH